MVFDLWPVYSGERFRASGPSCLEMEVVLKKIYHEAVSFPGISLIFGNGKTT